MAQEKEKKPQTVAAPKGDGKTPRERFLSVGSARVGKAIKAVRMVKNISNRKSYEYSETEVTKAIAALRSEVDALESAFKTALAGKTGAVEKDAFSFA